MRESRERLNCTPSVGDLLRVCDVCGEGKEEGHFDTRVDRLDCKTVTQLEDNYNPFTPSLPHPQSSLPHSLTPLPDLKTITLITDQILN